MRCGMQYLSGKSIALLGCPILSVNRALNHKSSVYVTFRSCVLQSLYTTEDYCMLKDQCAFHVASTRDIRHGLCQFLNILA